MLSKEHELRFEVADGSGFGHVKMLSGNAEIFGVELVEGRTYSFPPGSKLAVFTWFGAELHLSGNVTGVYTAADTLMPVYANLHQRLEARREEARVLGLHGPRVCVVGPTDSGKSTLCRILSAYAARVGRCPTFIDLDIGQGELSVPGCLAAATVERRALSVEEGYLAALPAGAVGAAAAAGASIAAAGGAGGSSSSSGGGAATVPTLAPAVGGAPPLVYFFGHVTPAESAEVYRNSLARLADTVSRRLTTDDTARVSGAIINTMGFIDGVGYDLLLDTVKALAADVVVVMGNDRLFARMVEDCGGLRFPVKPPAPGSSLAAAASASGSATAASAASAGGAGAGAGGGAGASSAGTGTGTTAVTLSEPMKNVTVIRLQRSGGVVERSRDARRDARSSRVRSYFYGPYRGPGVPPMLSPVVLSVGWDDVTIVRVGGAAVSLDHACVMCAVRAAVCINACIPSELSSGCAARLSYCCCHVGAYTLHRHRCAVPILPSLLRRLVSCFPVLFVRVDVHLHLSIPASTRVPASASARSSDYPRVLLLLQSDAGILPIGKASALDPLRTVIMMPTADLVKHVLGVSFATSEKQVPHVNVAGFVHV